MKLLDWDGLRAKGICHSKSQIYRQIAQGKFPKPAYSGKFPAWPEHEIDAHIERLIADRDGAGAPNGNA